MKEPFIILIFQGSNITQVMNKIGNIWKRLYTLKQYWIARHMKSRVTICCISIITGGKLVRSAEWGIYRMSHSVPSIKYYYRSCKRLEKRTEAMLIMSQFLWAKLKTLKKYSHHCITFLQKKRGAQSFRQLFLRKCQILHTYVWLYIHKTGRVLYIMQQQMIYLNYAFKLHGHMKRVTGASFFFYNRPT